MKIRDEGIIKAYRMLCYGGTFEDLNGFGITKW